MEVHTGKIISAQKAPTHFMLAAKIVILVATVVLYVMQMLIAVPLFGAFVLEENWGELDNTRLSAVGILLAVALVLDLVSFVLAIIGSAKQEEPKTGMTILIKALFIPFFLINITLYILSFLGMMNPFLMLGIPAVGFIGICLTYVYMFMTSAPDIVYTLIFCIKNKKRPTALMIVGVILEFFFLADLVGAILIHKSYKDITIEDNIR